MDARKAALVALKIYEYGKNDVAKNAQHSALIGFFKGVADGNITVGQEWPMTFLLKNSNFEASKEIDLLQDLVHSGMFCQGQSLSNRHRTSVKASL